MKWSPPVDYLRLVTLPLLARIGYHGTLQVIQRGHYPKGGGMARFRATPSSLTGVTKSERGEVTKVIGVTHSVRLPRHVAERQAAAAKQVVSENHLPPVQMDLDTSENGSSLGSGSGIVLCALTSEGGILGADCLGERGKPAEEVGSTAAKILVDDVESKAFLDRHMADMIVPYIALAEGESEISISRVTQHTLTNVQVAEWVGSVHFDHVGEVGKPGVLRVKGLGLTSEERIVSARQ